MPPKRQDPKGKKGGGNANNNKKQQQKKQNRIKAHKTGPKLKPLAGPFEKGQIIEYPKNYYVGKNKDELMEKDMSFEDVLVKYRRAAEAHRQARKLAKALIKPGISYYTLASSIEGYCIDLLGSCNLDAGLSFPCGLSYNHIAAHYTPVEGDFRVLRPNDVIKIDFGTHVDGYLIDSSSTVVVPSGNPADEDMFAPLLQASKEATEAAIKASGPDAILSDLSKLIDETICSYEIELDGMVRKIVPVRNLCGHSVGPYRVHTGKTIPNSAYSRKIPGVEGRMLEGEIFAVETFSTTGRGQVTADGIKSHWMLSDLGNTTNPSSVHDKAASSLLSYIQNTSSSLAFTQRWFTRDGLNWDKGFRELKRLNFVNPYPPLVDIPGSYVAQFEHTIAIKPSGIEVLSRGDDY